jgi:hypothetical protein
MIAVYPFDFKGILTYRKSATSKHAAATEVDKDCFYKGSSMMFKDGRG